MSFLEFQDELYLNVVQDDACLVILSRGLGIEQLMVRLCRTYSDDSNLVIVIGTNPEDELFLTNQLIDDKDVPYGKLPQRITAESSNTKKRHEIYLNGGVLFVTERILVVDILSNRVPLDLVTGILVYKAHRIYNDCLMSFILRLFRMKNKTGFIKALSCTPQAFFGDFGKLDKIMQSLFVTSLYLWPRFHASVQNSLNSKALPDVIEMNLPMSPTMKNIQFDIMDLIGMCLKELAKTNTAFLYDSDQLNVENAISKSFDSFIRKRFDEIWHQLGARAKRLINDIQWLRNLLYLLTQSDVVAFYNQTRAAQNSVRVGNEVSDWIFWKPADRLFKLSKERLYPNNSIIEDFAAETNLKWKAFQDLIDEIDRETKEIEDTVHIFIVVANDSVARLLEAILACGAHNVLRERVERFNAIIKSNTGNEDGLRLFGIQQDLTEEKSQVEENATGRTEPPTKKRFRAKNPAAKTREQTTSFTLTQIVRRMNEADGKTITIVDEENEESHDDDAPIVIEEKDIRPTKVHRLKLHYFSCRYSNIMFENSLRDYKPMHVIMYDLDVQTIRQVEVYQALYCHPKRCKVYTIQFENSFDMQQYLTSLRREKESFENLIREKRTLVIPSGRDGKTEGHPDLVRGGIVANETTNPENTRQAGGQVSRNDIIKQKILVDMREFRCELPAIIHKRGIEIEPIQLEIGDYILASDTCIERKSVSDLIQSLQSGRLYNQAAMMIRHFKRSILLIEFDENKSFHFKGRYWGMSGNQAPGYSGPKRDYSQDLVDRLILLTIHHPNLRIVWSPSTHFTAELFEYLKMDRPQPDSDTIASISSEELPPETFEDKYDLQAKDFLLKLPGVNSRNVYSLMNCRSTLAELVDVSLEELQELMGNSRSAELLYQTLHSSLKAIASEAIRSEQESKKSSLFSCTKRRKGLM